MRRYQMAEEGIFTSQVREAQVSYGISRQDMAGLLGVSEKTFYNLMGLTKLDADRSDRFLFIEKIFEAGEIALASRENLKSWLNLPHSNLSGKKPIELMETLTGAEAVYAEIIRTQHNVLS